MAGVMAMAITAMVSITHRVGNNSVPPFRQIGSSSKRKKNASRLARRSFLSPISLYISNRLYIVSIMPILNHRQAARGAVTLG
jgi:hypothetical protein